MSQELHSASEALQSTLERYLTTCRSLATTTATAKVSHSLTRELNSISSYEKKLNEAKTTIRVARNSSFSIVRISSLPDEIILRIFRLVIGVENSWLYPKYVHAGVGSLSALIIFGRILISHRKKLVSRAEIFASRAGTIPLNIHIIEQLKNNYNDDEAAEELEEFFISLGSRVGSLEIDFASGFHDLYSGVISRCLEHCGPGQLTQFILKFRAKAEKSTSGDYSSDDSCCQSDADTDFGLEDEEDSNDSSSSFGNSVTRDAFLYTRDRLNPKSGSWGLDITNPQLDEVLSPVTVLKLDKIFPCWTSKAYHGLVELRLVAWDPARESIQVKEQQLVAILKASPALQTLHFGIEITPAAKTYPPVQLKELEALHVQVDSLKSQQTLLRLLSPGARPLQMSIDHKSPGAVSPPSRGDEFHKLIRRSNIVKLFIDSRNDAKLHLPTFLALLPNLCVLVLRGITLDAISPSLTLPTRGTTPQLHSLHFLFGRIHLDAFRWVCDPKHLRLQRVSILQSTIDTSQRSAPYMLDQYAHLLKRIFPKLEILEGSDDFDAFQIKDWDDVMNARFATARA
ncbi:hypothetical protein RSOLAG22IIIB_11572 [Rhizoctonia solani]|uniref:Uncharacterized protein n=1 Tax=Rhizoctonia solani TaxID=456999 RepID=A0A0K6G9S3_9AGAM|nr:hypothetical protein RSOLAG22IIIB_11572 [Rhizoctonia solani]